MSKNQNNNTNTKGKVKEAITAEEKKRLDATKVFLLVFAIVAFLGIAASIIIPIVNNLNKKRQSAIFDYMNEDLGEYLYVPANLYKDYEVTINIDAVTDFDVENEIVKVLCANKVKPEKTPINKPNVTLSAGDVANIYYRGYTIEDGVKTYFDGGCNFNDNYTALEIGSGTFIPGFEYNLIGKNQKNYATLDRVFTGSTEPGDIISLTYSAYYADGTSKTSQTVLIDLSDENLDERWGGGFSEYFNDQQGKEIGKLFAGKNTGATLEVQTSTKAEGTDVYYNMTVNAAYRVSEGEKLEVESYFPKNYSDAGLAGKTAYFEVYISTAQDYEVPELNDAYVTETLKFTEEALSSYEGETLFDKYKSYVKAELVKTYEENVEAAIEDAFWTKAIEGATFYQLPESEVESYYNSYYDSINSMYASYSSYYSSLDAFARDYLGLSSSADWKATIRQNAESSVKQRLIFYYILRTENLFPSDAEYDKIYQVIFDEHLQSYLEYYNITEADENYELKVETGKQVVLADYGEEYFYELVLYDYVIGKIVSWAK